MKIYIIADLEGVSGVVDREQLVPGGYRYEEACKELTGELNCVVEGCLKAGAKEIIVHDGHNFGFNINRNLLHSKAKLITKGSRILIDNKFSALILVGYHGKAGSSAVLSHTYSFNSIKNLKFNGISVGEIGWHALIAGHYNIPVVLVSGCDVTCKEACNLLGKVETVVTKESIDKNSAICYSSEEIKKNLKEMQRKKPMKSCSRSTCTSRCSSSRSASFPSRWKLFISRWPSCRILSKVSRQWKRRLKQRLMFLCPEESLSKRP